MSAQALFFSHWKGKLASLFLAVAIWYLIDTHLRNPERVQFPIPGTNVNPLPDNSPNSVTPIPGGGSPSSSTLPTPPVRIEEGNFETDPLIGLYPPSDPLPTTAG